MSWTLSTAMQPAPRSMRTGRRTRRTKRRTARKLPPARSRKHVASLPMRSWTSRRLRQRRYPKRSPGQIRRSPGLTRLKRRLKKPAYRPAGHWNTPVRPASAPRMRRQPRSSPRKPGTTPLPLSTTWSSPGDTTGCSRPRWLREIWWKCRSTPSMTAPSSSGAQACCCSQFLNMRKWTGHISASCQTCRTPPSGARSSHRSGLLGKAAQSALDPVGRLPEGHRPGLPLRQRNGRLS